MTEIITTQDHANQIVDGLAVGAVIVVLCQAIIKSHILYRMGRRIYLTRKTMRRLHENYLHIMEYCRGMKDVWMKEFIEAKEKGLSDEKKYQQEHKTETRSGTEIKAYEVQLTRRF